MTDTAALSVRVSAAAVFAERARAVACLRSSEEALHGIVELALEMVAADHASMTLVGLDGQLESAAISGPTAQIADQIQYQLQTGPCLTAAEDGATYLIPETERENRWPGWGQRVAAMGLHSVLSLHLFTSRQTLGALNLYAARPDHFTSGDVETARIVAAHGSVVLARARSERNLWVAVDSRHMIGMAQGLLMERHGLTDDRAFALLKRVSQNSNLKLRDVAAQLLSTGELPADHPVTLEG